MALYFPGRHPTLESLPQPFAYAKHLCLASLGLQSSHLCFPYSWNEKCSHDAQLLLTDMVSSELFA
jgi:hypothetical protein